MIPRPGDMFEHQEDISAKSAAHLCAIFADVLENLSHPDTRDQSKRQDVQCGRKNKLPLPGQERRAVRKAVVRRYIRILILMAGFKIARGEQSIKRGKVVFQTNKIKCCHRKTTAVLITTRG